MNIAGWLVDTIVVAQRTGVDADGDTTYEAAAQMKARVEDVHVSFIDSNGDERLSNHRVAAKSEIRVGSKVWLTVASHADDGQPEKVLKRTGARDKQGITGHWEMLF